MKLYCLVNAPFMAGVETNVLSDIPAFTEDCVGTIYLDDPWPGVVPLTVVDYDEVTYATFNTVDSIMFNADCTAFKCGNDLWWGKLMAYLIPVGSKVLVA